MIEYLLLFERCGSTAITQTAKTRATLPRQFFHCFKMNHLYQIHSLRFEVCSTINARTLVDILHCLNSAGDA